MDIQAALEELLSLSDQAFHEVRDDIDIKLNEFIVKHDLIVAEFQRLQAVEAATKLRIA